MRPMLVIIHRDLLRFVRQPARIAAAVGTPVLIWVLFASGWSGMFSGGDATPTSGDGVATFAAFLLPGMMTLVVMFAAIFSSISIIEDRHQGWLAAVLISPAPRWQVLAGKAIGSAIPAWLQAMLMLAAAPLIGAWPGAAGAVHVALALAVTAFGVSCLGLSFAWRCESSQGFHAVMNLVFMPMWLLSGSFFDASRAAPWLKFMATINPLAWCNEAIRDAMHGHAPGASFMLAAAFAACAVGALAVGGSVRRS
jgi:ABC-2 type transport system permease protein